MVPARAAGEADRCRPVLRIHPRQELGEAVPQERGLLGPVEGRGLECLDELHQSGRVIRQGFSSVFLASPCRDGGEQPGAKQQPARQAVSPTRGSAAPQAHFTTPL